MLSTYAQALYQLQRYPLYVNVIDMVIIESIQHNIRQYQSKDIFFESLLNKSHALIYLQKYEEAQHITLELININPKNIRTPKLLSKAKIQINKHKIQPFRAISIALLITSALLTLLQLLIIKPLFPALASLFEITRYTLLFTAMFTLLLTQLFYRNKIKLEIKEIIKNALQKKQYH